MTKDTLFSFIKANINIKDYVESHPNTQSLKQSHGDTWRCNNIIAGGSNPTAMMLDESTGYFRVFSHGQEHGDIITLHQILNQIDNPLDAAEDLAHAHNITIPDELLAQNNGIKKQTLYQAMRTIAKTCHAYLMSEQDPHAATALDYLWQRGMTYQEMRTWGLGLMPPNPKQALEIVMQACNNNPTIAIATGMANKSKNSNELYVPMRGRILFPIINHNKQVQSFSARAIPNINCTNPDSKYINTRATTIFDKSTSLYGAHQLKGARRVVVCEGNLDAIAVSSALGSDTVGVAVCGTAFGRDHEFLVRGVEELTVLFDGDSAGRDAALKAAWVANYVPRARLCVMGGGLDPWDAAKSDTEGFRRMVGSAGDLIAGLVALAHQSMPESQFMTWLTMSYQSLTLIDARTSLLTAAANNTGMSVPVLESRMSNKGLKLGKKTDSTTNDTSYSDQVHSIVQCAWSLDSSQRMALFGTLGAEWFTYWGGVTDSEELNLVEATIFGLRSQHRDLLSQSQKMSPANEKMNHCVVAFAANIARKCLDHIHNNIATVDRLVTDMITPLNVVASGRSASQPEEQLLYSIQATLSMRV